MNSLAKTIIKIMRISGEIIIIVSGPSYMMVYLFGRSNRITAADIIAALLLCVLVTFVSYFIVSLLMSVIRFSLRKKLPDDDETKKIFGDLVV